MLVIFDLDGTLLNTIEDLTAATNYALRCNGFAPRSVEECRRFVGNGVSKLLQRALPAGEDTIEQVDRLRKDFVNYYDRHLWDSTFAYAGIEEVLNFCHARAIKLAVASNKYQHATQRLVTHFFASTPFAAVLGQREGIPVKPHPQIVYDILHRTQETAAGCLYVGDSPVDVQTAQNAGVRVCAVTWGFCPQAELAKCRPDYLLHTPPQLAEVLARLAAV